MQRRAISGTSRLDELLSRLGCPDEIAPVDSPSFGRRVGELIGPLPQRSCPECEAPRPAAAHDGSGIVSTGLEAACYKQRVSSLALRDDPRRRRFAFSKPDTASHAHGNESCNESDKKLFHLTSQTGKTAKISKDG